MGDTPLTPEFQTARPIPECVYADGVVPFYFAKHAIRGRLVRLGPIAEALLGHRHWPQGAKTIGGEIVALAAALNAGLKYTGTLSIQISGDGPISSLVSDCTSDGALRLYLRCAESSHLNESHYRLQDLFGGGYFACTIDPGASSQRYQGMVSLEGQTLAETAIHYLQTSEQHTCWVKLFCANVRGNWNAGALFLERIAQAPSVAEKEQSEEIDAWHTACILAQTLRANEIFDPQRSPEVMLKHLFHDFGVIADTPRKLSRGCRCSRTRIEQLLTQFSEDELAHMDVNGHIVMTCEFCALDFEFERDTLR